jgi:hypothetical protein
MTSYKLNLEQNKQEIPDLRVTIILKDRKLELDLHLP